MDWGAIVGGLMGALTILSGALAAYFHARAREITKKLDEVHDLVNSQKDELTKEIADLKSQIVELKK